MQDKLSLRDSTHLNMERFSQRKIFLKSAFLFIITYIMTQNLPSINSKLEQAQKKSNKNTIASRQIKSPTFKYMQQPWGFTLSNKKRDQIERARQLQIEREDKALTSRMVAINDRNRYRSQSEVVTVYLKSSLHEGLRKESNQVIAEQNQSKKKRLQSLKPTIDLKKMYKQWQNKQSIKKNLQRYYSKDSKCRSMSIQLDKLHRITINERKIVKFYKQRCIEGYNILIKIEQYNHVVLITGEIKSKDQLVYLVIKKDKIEHILQEYNKTKIQILGNLLKYDAQTTSLYLIPKESISSQKKEYFISSKIDDFNIKKIRKQIRQQHIEFERQILTKKQSQKNEDQKKLLPQILKTERQQPIINNKS